MKPTDPALPHATVNIGSGLQVSRGVELADGMTIRCYIAMAALQGLLAHNGIGLYERFTSFEESLNKTSEQAVQYADALIEALAKDTTHG